MIESMTRTDIRRTSISELAEDMVSGRASHEEMLTTLTALAVKGETPEQIRAFAEAFAAASVKVHTRHRTVADLCGTGGASFRTFNVSTISAFVVAGCEMPVAKHGNRSSSGVCGSADLLTALGANPIIGPELAEKMLDEIGMTFLFAPHYHPAMRNVAAVRKELRSKTVFNIIGPLINPVEADRMQLMGVYDPKLLHIVPGIMNELGIRRALVVHGFPGMDEVSTLGTTQAVLLDRGRTEQIEIAPKSLGFDPPRPEVISELTPDLSAKAARRVLSGSPGPRRDMVVLNSASALFACDRVKNIEEGIDMASMSIDSGKAMRILTEFIEMSRAEQ
ncbi:MAG TPA: anthranilate phosphoribosyltransferase [Methanomassiliicoccales archaeon]|jgi:anthranilate phosphoribosyltransferase